MKELYDYERVLRERAAKKAGGIKVKQRMIGTTELLLVRKALRSTAMSKHVGERDVLVVDFQRLYLLRISEVLSLNEKAFDWERQEFTIYAFYEKNAKEKTYSLKGAPTWFLESLGRYLRKYRHTFKGGYLFTSTSCPSKERPYILAKTWIHERWRKAVRAAGVSDPRMCADGRMYERVRSHGWRRAGITELIKQGVPIKKIAAFTQTHPATIMNYYNMVDEDAAKKEIMQLHVSKAKR